MKSIWIRTVLVISCVLSPFGAFADWQETLQDDFKTLTGVVVMKVGNEYLIDLDANSGLKPGDILSIVRDGTEIKHPVTGEVLGHLDSVRGFLQVTRMKSGYSYVKPLGEDQALAPGEKLERYAQTPIKIDSALAKNTNLANKVRAALNQMEWRGDDNNTLLFATLQAGQLQIKTTDGATLGQYDVDDEVSVTRPSTVLVTPPLATPSSVPAGIELSVSNEQSIWRGPAINETLVALASGDFDGDGAIETALATATQIKIVRITEGKQVLVAEVDVPNYGRAVAIDALDIDGDRRDELYVTASKEGTLTSFRIIFEQGDYGVDLQNLDWMMRVGNVKGTLRLIGQRLGDPHSPFEWTPHILVMDEDKLIEGPPVDLPGGDSIFGLNSVQGKEGVVRLTKNDDLKVLAVDGEVLWESSNKYGGTEDYIAQVVNESRNEETYYAGIQAPIHSYDNLLLIPKNDGSRLLAYSKEFDSSQVIAMQWDGFSLQERWRTQPQSGYLADFEVADADNDGRDEIVMAVVYSRKGLMSKSRAALLIYELP